MDQERQQRGHGPLAKVAAGVGQREHAEAAAVELARVSGDRR